MNIKHSFTNNGENFEMINKNLITKLINHKFINFRRDKYKYIIGICIHSIFVGLG